MTMLCTDSLEKHKTAILYTNIHFSPLQNEQPHTHTHMPQPATPP